nr:MAG TPA: hypothetical protein [Caudoviricetes sp.]
MNFCLFCHLTNSPKVWYNERLDRAKPGRLRPIGPEFSSLTPYAIFSLLLVAHHIASIFPEN